MVRIRKVLREAYAEHFSNKARYFGDTLVDEF